jgi:hypothetical protein
MYFKCSVKVSGATGVQRGVDGEFRLTKGHNEHEPVALDELKNLFVERLRTNAPRMKQIPSRIDIFLKICVDD